MVQNEIAQSISSYNRIGHDYLLSRPYVYNGGSIAQIITTTSDTFNFNIGNYIFQFFFNSSFQVSSFHNSSISSTTTSVNNLTTTVFGLIYLFITFICCFVVVIVWIIWRLNKYNPLIIKYFDMLTQKLNLSAPQPKVFCFFTDIELKKRKKKFFNHILILCTICCILLFLFLLSFIFVATSQSELQKQLMSSSNSSFQSSWQQSTQHFDKFFDLMIYESSDMFHQTLDKIATTIKTLIFDSLNKLTAQLLLKFGVNDIFDNAQKLIKNLEETVQSMEYIKNNSGSFSKQINFQSGNLNANIYQLQFLINQVCARLVVTEDCMNYLKASMQLRIRLNTSLINDHSSVNMFFLVTQFKLNLTTLALKVTTMESNVYDQIRTQTKEQVNKLNIDASIQGVRSSWSYVTNAIVPLRQQFIATTQSVSSAVQTYGATFFVIISLVLVGLFVIVLLYTATLIRCTMLYYFERNLISGRIKAPKSKPISVLDNFKKKRNVYALRKQYKLCNAVIYSYLVIYCSLIGFTLLLSLIIINVSHLLYNEVCIQVGHSDGLSMIDNYLDSTLSNRWSNLTSSFLTTEMKKLFSIPQPKRILTSIRNNCTKDNGLLQALQITDLVNISTIIWTEDNWKNLYNGLNLTYEAFVRMDTKSMIPADMVEFIKTAKEIGKYLDETNYKPTIDELSNGVIELPNYSVWLNSSIRYFTSINNSNAFDVVRLLRILSSKVPIWQQLERDILSLRTHFQAIEQRRSNSVYIQGLMDAIYKVQTLIDSTTTYDDVKNLYTHIMIREFPVAAEASVSGLVTSMIGNIFPCNSLSSAIGGLLNNLCASDSSIEKMCSYGLNMTVLCSCMIIMFHFLWNVLRKELEENEEENVSNC